MNEEEKKRTKERMQASLDWIKDDEESLMEWQDKNPTPPWDFRRAARGDRPPSVTLTVSGPIVRNRHGKIYHWPDCPDYTKVSPDNRVTFQSREEAEKAGYRQAKNCP
jgi:hypothetical protein